jgi:O-antigen/teichoic acid export membrane protein
MFGTNMAVLGGIFSAGRLLAACVGAFYRRALTGRIAAGYPRPEPAALLSHIPVFFAVTALPLLLMRADLLVIGATASERDLGLYSGAARIAAILLLAPDGIMLANFARLSRVTEPDRLRAVVMRLAVLAVATLVPLAGVVTVFASAISRLVYGSAFSPGGQYLSLLVWSVPLFILCRAFGDALIAAGHQRHLARVIIGTAAASVPIYWTLTVRFGPLGVGGAYLASQVVLLAASAVTFWWLITPGAALAAVEPYRHTGATQEGR